MSFPPPYASMSASTESIALSESGCSCTTSTSAESTDEPYEPEYFIFCSLSSIIAWLIIGLIAYGGVVTDDNVNALAFLALILAFTMLGTTPFAYGLAPNGWFGKGVHAGMSILVVWSSTITYIIVTSGWDNQCGLVFINLGTIYAGILLERFVAMFCGCLHSCRPSTREEEYALSSAV